MKPYSPEMEKLLTKGLLAGYVGKNEFGKVIKEKVNRGPVRFTVTSFLSPDGGQYQDGWSKGGGQEVGQQGEEKATRLYAGDTLSDEELRQIGITHDQIIKYHQGKLDELSGRTRLFEDCSPEPDGDWQYRYEVIRNLEAIPLVIALETIRYKDRTVFAHGFLHAKIR